MSVIKTARLEGVLVVGHVSRDGFGVVWWTVGLDSLDLHIVRYEYFSIPLEIQ
jgi:hypothetical protein